MENKIITFASIKGGVGKSVSALFTAQILNDNGLNVLLIDLDSQNSITSNFIKDYEIIEGKTIYNLLKGEICVEETIFNIKHGFDLIPSELDLIKIDREFNNFTGREFLLKNRISDIIDNYDFVIIDTAPNLNLETILGLSIASTIIIPVQLERWAVRGIMILMNEINLIREYINKNLYSIKCLPTFYEENRIIPQQVLELVKNNFSELTLNTKVHRASDIQKSIAYQSKLPKNTRAYKEYSDFLSEIGVLIYAPH